MCQPNKCMCFPVSHLKTSHVPLFWGDLCASKPNYMSNARPTCNKDPRLCLVLWFPKVPKTDDPWNYGKSLCQENTYIIILSFPTQMNISSTIVGLVDQSENLPATNMEYLARNTAKVTGDHHDHHPNWDVHQIFWHYQPGDNYRNMMKHGIHVERTCSYQKPVHILNSTWICGLAKFSNGSLNSWAPNLHLRSAAGVWASESSRSSRSSTWHRPSDAPCDGERPQKISWNPLRWHPEHDLKTCISPHLPGEGSLDFNRAATPPMDLSHIAHIASSGCCGPRLDPNTCQREC